MKKVVASFLAGALFTVGATSFADEIETLIGKKVQGEAEVTANGSPLDKAVIVEGKSYAPVRSIAEAAGMQVQYENGVISLTEETPTEPTTDPTPEQVEGTPAEEQTPEDNQTPVEEQPSPEETVNWEEDEMIKMWQSQIDDYQSLIDAAEKYLEDPTVSEVDARGSRQLIDSYQQLLDNATKQIENRKAYLQSQPQETAS